MGYFGLDCKRINGVRANGFISKAKNHIKPPANSFLPGASSPRRGGRGTVEHRSGRSGDHPHLLSPPGVSWPSFWIKLSVDG